MYNFQFSLMNMYSFSSKQALQQTVNKYRILINDIHVVLRRVVYWYQCILKYKNMRWIDGGIQDIYCRNSFNFVICLKVFIIKMWKRMLHLKCTILLLTNAIPISQQYIMNIQIISISPTYSSNNSILLSDTFGILPHLLCS